MNQIQALAGLLWVHDANQKMAIQRAAVAMGYGLDPSQFDRPFPGSLNVNVQAPPIEHKPAGSSWLKILGIIGLSIGMAALGAGAVAYFLWPKAPTVNHIDLDFIPLGADGKPKVEAVK